MSAAVRLLAFLLVGFVLACATRMDRPEFEEAEVAEERRQQTVLALSMLLERQARTWRVGAHTRKAGAELCDDTRYTFGFLALDPETFSADYRRVAGDLGLGAGVRIWDVLPGFAAGAEIPRGHRIAAIDGRKVTDFRSFEEAMKKPFETGLLTVELIALDGSETSVSLAGAPTCDYRVAAIEQDAVNAYADGRNVFITTGMLRFVESDDELAIVVGHELAHNMLGHLKQRRAQVLAGMLVDLAIAVFGGVETGGLFTDLSAIAFSEGMEADADYLGLYLAARAGYGIGAAPDFWRRMAVEHPAHIEDNMFATHPSSPERAVALKHTIAEIEAKRRAGLPLVPRYD